MQTPRPCFLYTCRLPVPSNDTCTNHDFTIGLAFDTTMHASTICAVRNYYRKIRYSRNQVSNVTAPLQQGSHF